MAQSQPKALRRRIAGAYTSSVISISLVLLLTGFASMLLVNARKVGDYFRENVHLTVLLKPGATDAQAARYKRETDRQPFVLDSRVIGREEGMAEMREMLGDDFFEAFSASSVPVSVEVKLRPEWLDDPSKLDAAIESLSESDLVDEVDCRRSLIDAMMSNIAKVSAVLGILTAFLLFVSVVLIGNTVRLSIFSNRFTIRTMQLVGATRSFIMRPYLQSAAVQGLLSSVLSIAVLVALMYVVKESFPRIFDVFSPAVLAEVMLIMLLAGVAICLTSTYFVVRRIAAMSKDELYG